MAGHWRRATCALAPGQSMPWVASLFARYKVDLDKIVRLRARKARKKAVTVKYAGQTMRHEFKRSG